MDSDTFRIEGLVSTLLHTLGVDASASECAAILRRTRVPSTSLPLLSPSSSSPQHPAYSPQEIALAVALATSLDADAAADFRARFDSLNREKVQSLPAFLELADRIKSDKAIAHLVRASRPTMASTAASGVSRGRQGVVAGANAITGLGLPKPMISALSSFSAAAGNSVTPTPNRVRSASVTLVQSQAQDSFINQISAISGTPSAASPSFQNPTARLRRSASQNRSSNLLRKQTSKTSLSSTNASENLKNLKAPFTCRIPKNNYFNSKNPKEIRVKPINSFSVVEQESFILEDLLYVLLGMDGIYIKKANSNPPSENKNHISNPSFAVDGNLDGSLSALIKRILPLAADYVTVESFLDIYSKFEAGKVCHALVAAMRGISKDYVTLVAQLEHQIRFAPSFGLQKLWYHVLPSAHIMKLLAKLAVDIHAVEVDVFSEFELFDDDSTAVGAPSISSTVLSILADKIVTTGDTTARATYAHLLAAAGAPYLTILRSWIRTGKIGDPFNEFFVVEKHGMGTDGIVRDFNDAYWERRYTVNNARVPHFLENVKEKVLLAGKYLNVVGECGIVSKESDAIKDSGVGESVLAFGEVVQVLDGGRFIEEIEHAYRSLKHYFLLDQGDFLVHFMDVAFSELHKPRSQVSVETLRTILELVLRTPGCVSYNDPHKDDITVELSNYSLVDQLLKVTGVVGVDYHDVFVKSGDGSTVVDMSKIGLLGLSNNREDLDDVLRGIDAVTLGYNAVFPVSLIVNRRVVTKYQLLFRHLLHCKNIERQLTNVWSLKAKYRRKCCLGKQKAKLSKALSSGVSISSAEQELETGFLTRLSVVQARMLDFVQQFLRFICIDIIEPNWREFEKYLNKASTVDDVLKYHNDFLDTCLKDCLLTNQKLLKHFGTLMNLFSEFADFASQLFQERLALSHYEDIASNSDVSSIEHEYHDTSATSKASRLLAYFENKQLQTVREFIYALQFADSISVLDPTGVIAGGAGTAVLQDLVSRIDLTHFYSRASVMQSGGFGGLVG
ncbi:Gamma-tubulin complex component 2 [Entophlyctis luteolus]|nr:Gamma-tubulin complex component 2 [Entophlyctis luteolus]